MNVVNSLLVSFRTVVSPLTAFFAGTIFAYCGFALLNSILAIRLSNNGVSVGYAGIILSIYYVGYVVASLTAHKVINKVGHIRAFSTYVSLFSALVLMHYFSPNPPFWGLLRLLEGYCAGSSMMCLESWLNTRSSNKNRGMIMALYMLTTYFGSGLGQLMLNIPDASGVVIYIIVSVIFSVALVPISLTALPTPDITIHKSMSLLKLYQKVPVGVVGCIVSGMIVGAFYSLGTIYASQIGLDIKHTSLFMFFVIIGGMLAQLPIGKISDYLDRRFILMWVGGFLFLVVPWLHFFIDNGAIPLMIGSILLGAGMFVIYPICVSHINDKIEDGERVQASGLVIMLQSLGMISGPIIISFAMQHWGPFSFFIAFSIITGAFVLFTLQYIFVRPQVNYVNVTPTVPMPVAPTHAFNELSQDDTLIDKAKDLFQEKH